MYSDPMREAIRLARRGFGRTSPNPSVGAVLVRDGQLLGRGYHRGFGLPHAEVEAVADADRQHHELRGATLFVTLEPCSHYGKTPPCAELLIKRGLATVVYGSLDPNPLVAGKGLAMLTATGIEVFPYKDERACRDLNPGFFRVMERGLPHVALKIAQTLDGRIAPSCGDARWITGEASRRHVHALRARYDAILVGAGTVRQDDPALTVRHVRGRQPWRIVLDTRLDLPSTSAVFCDAHAARTLVVTSCTEEHRHRVTTGHGASILTVPLDSSGRIELGALLRQLPSRGIHSVLVEGGAKVFTELLRLHLADRLLLYLAPKILGSGLPSVGDLGCTDMSGAWLCTPRSSHRFGDDLLLEFDLPEGDPPCSRG
ncbi:MAG: riboflavin biosynthesis protein RibD [Deltaproteobacteria bacterium RIFOXYA12_FULL_61_11]|nr:MAG: riboflavin biosynthesis protein RibD [Deltaproteobacteria bacterium RIFOXYA12_FULL_61_11]